MAQTQRGSRGDRIFNIVLLGILAFVLSMPSSPLRQSIQRFINEQKAAQVVADHWNILTATSTRIDSGEGTVVLVEFADYQCPWCRRAQPILSELAETNPDVGIAFRFLPLSGSYPLAEPAAVAAICAEVQGRFPSMHELLYEAVNGDQEPQWLELANRAGVNDLSAFQACLNSDLPRNRLQEDAKLASSLGITGTPTYVHRGGIDLGAPSDLIGFERMLAKAR